MNFDYDAQLKAAQDAAVGLKEQLEELILGRTRAPWQCGCGTLSHGEAEAIEVVPAGREKRYEGQITQWFLWSVKMRDHGQSEGYSYSCGISDFILTDTIKTMFGEAFKGIDGDTLETECYRLHPR